jgi:hypothetical protein
MTFRIAVVQPISHKPGEDQADTADGRPSGLRSAS